LVVGRGLISDVARVVLKHSLGELAGARRIPFGERGDHCEALIGELDDC